MGRRPTKAERAAKKAAEELKSLLDLAEANGVDEHDLRRPVVAAFMHSDPDGEPHPDAPQYRMLEDAAVVINNEGIERQLDALLDILGFEKTRALILKNGSVLKAMAKAVDQAEKQEKEETE